MCTGLLHTWRGGNVPGAVDELPDNPWIPETVSAEE
jgi:hypothetical protein